MSDALYERYKDALRRGHVAASRGRQDAALAAYGEAAKLAPDRSLPLVGIGNVLAGIGKHTEAVTAFDAALERVPADEAALRGRADSLVATGDRVRAAETLDRLAAALDANGRTSEALDAARRALELAESRSRRDGVKAMVARVSQSGTGGDPGVGETLSRALGILEDRVLGRTGTRRGRRTLAEPVGGEPSKPRRPRRHPRNQPNPSHFPSPNRRPAPVRSGGRHGRGRERCGRRATPSRPASSRWPRRPAFVTPASSTPPSTCATRRWPRARPIPACISRSPSSTSTSAGARPRPTSWSCSPASRSSATIARPGPACARSSSARLSDDPRLVSLCA